MTWCPLHCVLFFLGESIQGARIKVFEGQIQPCFSLSTVGEMKVKNLWFLKWRLTGTSRNQSFLISPNDVEPWTVDNKFYKQTIRTLTAWNWNEKKNTMFFLSYDLDPSPPSLLVLTANLSCPIERRKTKGGKLSAFVVVRGGPGAK